MAERLQGAALLEYVIAVSRRMAETRELDALLSYAVDEVLQLVGAEREYIVLVYEEGSLDFKVKRQSDGTDLEDVRDEISHSILNEVVSTGQTLVLSNEN